VIYDPDSDRSLAVPGQTDGADTVGITDELKRLGSAARLMKESCAMSTKSHVGSSILPLRELVLSPEMQMRAAGLNDDHVADLGEVLKENKKLPRVQIRLAVRDEKLGAQHFVTDGYLACNLSMRLALGCESVTWDLRLVAVDASRCPGHVGRIANLTGAE
jgi:hypothetical protein